MYLLSLAFKILGTHSEFLLWLSRLRTWHSVQEDAGLIPSLGEGLKDLALPQAVAYTTDVAWIHCFCGCTIGLSCSSNLTPSPGTSICCGYSHKKKNILGIHIPLFHFILLKAGPWPSQWWVSFSCAGKSSTLRGYPLVSNLLSH